MSSKKVCRGQAFQNEGQSACFETDDYPHTTFAYDNVGGECGPGMTAEIWATVDPKAKTAVFYSEVE